MTRCDSRGQLSFMGVNSHSLVIKLLAWLPDNGRSESPFHKVAIGSLEPNSDLTDLSQMGHLPTTVTTAPTLALPMDRSVSGLFANRLTGAGICRFQFAMRDQSGRPFWCRRETRASILYQSMAVPIAPNTTRPAKLSSRMVHPSQK